MLIRYNFYMCSMASVYKRQRGSTSLRKKWHWNHIPASQGMFCGEDEEIKGVCLMGEKTRKYFYVLIVTQVLACIVIMFAAFFWTKALSEQTKEALEQEAMHMVEDGMRGRISHVFASIDSEADRITREIEKFARFASGTLETRSEDDIGEVLELWVPEMAEMEYGRALKIILHDTQKKTITMYWDDKVKDLTGEFDQSSLKEYVEAASVCESLSVGSMNLYIYADQDAVKEIVKGSIYDVIHAAIYGEDAYVWVNEIINYEGGEDYAIRAIHPNLADTEGAYLSTDIADIEGNLPYLAELEGIKENGEIFHTYYFKNRSDDRIVEKLSYARLYEPFDWVIATGEPIEDIVAYSDELASYNARFMKGVLLDILLVMLAAFAIMIVVIVMVQRKNHTTIDAYIQTKTRLDPLTGALNREAGESALEEEFQRHRAGKGSAMLLMLSFDDFKKINDTYGHDMGDTVLKRTVQEIFGHIRATDSIARWGGEEFLIMCRDMEKGDHQKVGEKLLECVNSVFFECDGVPFNITASIGGAFFGASDTEYMQALKRADEALRHSKRLGKNQYTCEDGEVQRR